MCSSSKNPMSLWPGCQKDFSYYNVLTYNKLADRKPKSCSPCDNDHSPFFHSPFAPKTIKSPGWITYNNHILRFYAFFQEPIGESSLENYRVHHVHILYYLEDETLSVLEPPTYDPGFPQGKLIRRHRVPHPHPCQDSFISLQELNVGCSLEIYGKSFFITGCDPFTRGFLNRQGYSVPLDMDPPPDMATETRKEAFRLRTLITGGANVEGCRLVEKGRQFLANSGRVLRFWSYWDERCRGGRLRRFQFLFYLQDDTVEIREILEGGGGGGQSSHFLRRQRLLKNAGDLVHLPGFTDEGFEVLNTSGLGDGSGELTCTEYLTDRLYTGHEKMEFYRDKDLAIGATIGVYGRAFILTEADEFTKKYYRDKYGVEDFTPLVLDEPTCPPDRRSDYSCPPQRWELDEKSLENWGSHTESLPRRDLRSLLRDKDILCFSAILDNPLHNVNTCRRFTIKFHLVDSSFEILEHMHWNSGFPSGLFLVRRRVKKPLEEGGHGSRFYSPPDMFIGNRVLVNGFEFILMGAGESTLSLMEQHPNIFPQSNLCCILSKVRESFGPHPADDILLRFSSNDRDKNGVMSGRDFRCLLLDLTKDSLSEHELTTLIRAFRVSHPRGEPDMETLQSILHTQLKKFRFDRMLLQRLEYNFRQLDPCHRGSVERGMVRTLLLGAKVPLRKELIDFLVINFPSSDSPLHLNYSHLLKFMDWENCQVPEAKPAAVACIMGHLCPQPPPVINCVNYRAFLEEVCFED